MRHFASASFWQAYEQLPEQVRALADRNFTLLKQNPQHPSLHFKKIGRFRSVRVGPRYRALAVEVTDGHVAAHPVAALLLERLDADCRLGGAGFPSAPAADNHHTPISGKIAPAGIEDRR
ncbi:MAG: hypothetical protein Q8P46_13450 [Hyphomicrobiales bacterium]|nr:hypothetical protein [Hyphomicrobiales bacterium]